MKCVAILAQDLLAQTSLVFAHPLQVAVPCRSLTTSRPSTVGVVSGSRPKRPTIIGALFGVGGPFEGEHTVALADARNGVDKHFAPLSLTILNDGIVKHFASPLMILNGGFINYFVCPHAHGGP